MAPQDDFLAFFGQVVGLVHLFQLVEFFLSVGEIILTALDRVVCVIFQLRSVDGEEAGLIFVGVLFCPAGGGELQVGGCLLDLKENGLPQCLFVCHDYVQVCLCLFHLISGKESAEERKR